MVRSTMRSVLPTCLQLYLDLDPSITEERAKAIFKRGGLTKEEAQSEATETIAKSKKMQFDLRVTMMRQVQRGR